ncbi:MAG: cbb3-type cytochrome oxidase assembly protein CcoS [Deltaproteobacteria bacterium]|nr:cbb3-type cytochrome oxidase assembly protein CcoS [Deltaproteobacteria bacterium]
MTLMTLILLASAVLMAAGAGLIFAWAARSGQFDDMEEAKYQMLREDTQK